MVRKEIKILSFSNRTGEDRKLLRKFIDFHRQHYRNDPQYIPLLDYEYLGSRLLGAPGLKQIMHVLSWEIPIMRPKEEFDKIIDDMQLIFAKNLFVFAYGRGEPAGFFGGVLNILEKMRPIPGLKRFELLRAAKMFLSLKGIKGFRLGYLGVRRKFCHLGPVGILLWKQKIYSQPHGYQYSDIGWVLEDNEPVIRPTEAVG